VSPRPRCANFCALEISRKPQRIASGRYTFAVLAVQRTLDVPRGASQLALQAE